MTKDEALKLALSALDEVRQETFRLMRDGQTLYAEKKVWEAIYTIKKVLAQPQRTWVGLSDEEILDVNMSTVTKLIDEPIVCDTDHNIIQLAKAIEAKLRSKNT